MRLSADPRAFRWLWGREPMRRALGLPLLVPCSSLGRCQSAAGAAGGARGDREARDTNPPQGSPALGAKALRIEILSLGFVTTPSHYEYFLKSDQFPGALSERKESLTSVAPKSH